MNSRPGRKPFPAGGKTIMKLHKLGLTLSLLLTAFLRLGAQSVTLMVDQVPIENDPKKKEIHALLLDRAGFLWIGSQNGLARFDGYRVVSFPINEDTESGLPVRGLCQAPDGLLWLATPRGLRRYDPVEGTRASFRHEAGRPETISSDDLTCLHVAAAMPGRLWVASAAGTLDEIDMASGRVNRRLPAPGSFSRLHPGRIHALGSDAAGVLWIGAETGLYRFLPIDGRLLPWTLPPAEPALNNSAAVRAIFGDSRSPGNLWLGSETSGLLRYLPTAGAWQHCQEAGDFASPTDENVCINSIATFPGDAEDLLIGTATGLYRFKPASGRCFRVPLLIDGKFIQGGRFIRLIYLDANGIYWIGSRDDGLFKWSKLSKKFSRFRPFIENRPSPLANWVTSIQDFGGDEILVTTYGGGAMVFDRQSSAFRPLLLEPGRPERKLNRFITDTRYTRDGSLWFATGEGMARCSPSGRLQKLHVLSDDKNEDILAFTFIQDSRGLIWIGTDRGLLRLDPVNGALRRFRHDHLDPLSLSSDRVNTLMEGPEGDIWAGTEDGLNLYRPRADRFTVFKSAGGDPAGLAGSQVNFLLQDSQGRIWIGTDRGLDQVERKDGRIVFRHFRAPGDDPNQNLFRSLVEESANRFWTGTSAGLARFDSDRGTFTFYDRRDGVEAEGLNEIFFFKRGRDGEIYFGDRGGFTVFRPDEIALNRHPPPVVTTGFRIFNDRDEAAAGDLFAMGSLPRSTTVNKLLRIEFAALDFTRPEKNQYAYRLEGRDRDWIYQGTNRVVELQGLALGAHTLHVKAANNDGIWNENGESMIINVRLSFWERWRLPIMAVLFLAALAAGFLWLRRRSRRLRDAAIPANIDQFTERFALSRREGEILRLLLAGKSNKEIENELFIAMATVKIHVHNIFRKVKVNSRMKLLLRVQQEAKKNS
jgi:ligand-binding sensor domain-containing protein/DNA-binding CsgD family transcriptional regulator